MGEPDGFVFGRKLGEVRSERLPEIDIPDDLQSAEDEASSTRISFLSWTAICAEGVSLPPNRHTHQAWLHELNVLRRSIALHPVGFRNYVRKKRGQSGYWNPFQGLRSVFVSWPGKFGQPDVCVLVSEHNIVCTLNASMFSDASFGSSFQPAAVT